MAYGLIAVLNNTQLDQMKAQQDAGRGLGLAAPAPDRYQHLVTRLSSYVERVWEQNRNAKNSIELEMLEDLRQRQGEYSPSKLAAIREQGGSEIYMMLTNMKCRALEGWLRDILMPAGERPMSCVPSPEPSLPPDIMRGIAEQIAQQAQMAIQSGAYITPQEVYDRAREVGEQLKVRLKEEAEIRAKRMEDKIDDLHVQGGWYDALDAFIADLATFPTAIFKGPVMRRTSQLKWEQDPATGKWVPRASEEITPVYYTVSPFDAFPAPGARGPEDGPFCEKISVRRGQLYAMIGVPGYKEEAIRAALDEYSHGYTVDTSSNQQRRSLENSENWQLEADKPLDIIEMHDSIRGELLVEWGIEPERVPDPDAEYEVTVWKLGRFIIRCVLNEHPMKKRPYEISSFDKINGQFWGRGVPRVIRDLQDMCNAAARSLVNNMAISSGPLTEVEANRLAEGEEITQLYPWRIVQTKSSPTTPAPAVRFHNVPSNAQELIAVYTYFSNLADHYSGIQSYDTGVNSTSGAAGTASGLSMLMSASSRQMKRVVAGIDRVIKGSSDRTHYHVMLHDPDESVKGDLQLQARGAGSLIAKEQQQMRKTEFLAATSNPIDAQIIGPLGRAELLREVIKSFDMNPDKIIPSKDQLMQQMRAAMMAAIPANPQPPAGQGQAQLPAPRNTDAAGQPAGGTDAALFAA